MPEQKSAEEIRESRRAVLDDLMARAVADELERDRELLRIPLENISRWLSRGVISSPAWFERWRVLLEEALRNDEAFHRVLVLLRTDTAEARRWRDFSPFAGVLSATKRRELIRECKYSH
jgi:hypothetical protein